MKTKENCFRNFNDVKVILSDNKKPTSNVCKKIENSCFSFHIILQCIQIFRIIYIVQSYSKVFFGTSVLLSYI